MEFGTPIAFFIFNRPELTRRVFARIAEIRPSRLLIAADGPRNEADVPLCEEARSVVSRVDWKCDVLTDYSPRNLGCALRESSAVEWVFRSCEEAIFLEDDTLPSVSFFRYCSKLLERYRDDERVMHVSGNNFQRGRRRGAGSYYFSKYPHVWGWATWRRAWRHYDFRLELWPRLREEGLLRDLCDDPHEARYWGEIFDRIHKDPLEYNDYGTQWLFSCWVQSGLACLPQVNLVSNIGFGAGATHTTHASENADIPAQELTEIAHPPTMVRDREADLFTFDHAFGGRYRRRGRLLNAVARLTWPLRARLRGLNR